MHYYNVMCSYIISNTRDKSSSSHVYRPRILINNWSRQCFYLGEVHGGCRRRKWPTSSGNAKQGKIEEIKTATFYQWKYIDYFTVASRGGRSDCAGTLQAANHFQMLETLNYSS